MSIQDELRALSHQLSGDGWTRKFPEEWSPFDQRMADGAKHRSSRGDDEARKQMAAHLEWCLDQPILFEDLGYIRRGDKPAR